jgi:NAD(P)-dependent dehydrogenase (short-subunit alcohol dehydrogenase family)
LKNLAGKTAFVTGAASGIGLGIATALAQAGVKVMLCDIEEAALASAVEGLKRTNADVASVRADVSLKAELQAAAEETRAKYGNVHILINNAMRAWVASDLTARGATLAGTGHLTSISWPWSGALRFLRR